MPPKRRTIAPIKPNVGLEMAYRRALYALIADMHENVAWTLKLTYEAKTPEIAKDALPATTLIRAMRRLTRKWQRRFDEAAPALAEYFSRSAGERVAGQLAAILKTGGLSVGFQTTPVVRDVLAATTGENVGLIRSIAQQHLAEVEGLVMRSVATGRDLATLSGDLQKRFQVTKRRAALIARDQNNKATAVITRTRQKELGVTRAVWMHSGGGKEPRPSHVAFNGHEYDIDKGAYLDGKWVWPGTEINCRCVSKSVMPGFLPEPA